MRQPLSRDAILKAARDILVAEGLPSVSLRKVASRLGVTAPALYAHVADKHDLLQGIAERELQRLIRSFEAADHADPLERLRHRARAYVAYAEANAEAFRAMFLRLPELTAESRTGDEPLAVQAFRRGAEPVFEAVKAGMFRDTDPLLAATTLWAGMHGVAVVLLSGPELDDRLRKSLADSMIDTLIDGYRRTG